MLVFKNLTCKGALDHCFGQGASLPLGNRKTQNMKKILFFCLILATNSLLAQNKNIETETQTWLGYVTQTRLNEKWSLWFDIHYRQKDRFLNHYALQLHRIALIYHLSPQIRLFAGYAYLHNAPQGSQIRSPEEHRPWQQIQYTQEFPHFRLLQSIRLEQRFRENVSKDQSLGYLFNHRIRYNMSFFIPLSPRKFEPKTWFALFATDTHLNFGENVVYNHLDQNRIIVSLGYQFSKNLQLQAGYMNIYQQLATGYQFKNIHALRIYLFHQFDWRKNAEKH